MISVILLFALGLVLLIKGGDWFVNGATAIAHRFHLPELLIGATVVSIGTTLPEVMVSANSALNGVGGIAYGNAIGSVICNTSLIAALTIAIRPAAINRKSLLLPSGFFYAAAAVYTITAYAMGRFERWIGLVLLAMFVVYILTSIRQMQRHPEAMEEEDEGAGEQKERTLAQQILLLAAGAGAIAWGADLLVDNGTKIATALGVPDSVIGLTMVALGTSLPELVTAVTALMKGHGALSLGNVIGANLFNLVLVTGTAATLAPFAIPEGNTIAGINASLVVDIPVMLGVMLILCVPALLTGKLKRWQGIVLLAVYAAFTVFQFVG